MHLGRFDESRGETRKANLPRATRSLVAEIDRRLRHGPLTKPRHGSWVWQVWLESAT